MKRITTSTCWSRLVTCALTGSAGPQLPMPETVENSARYRWENKSVLECRLLDDAENPATWLHDDLGEMSFSTERAKDGKQSVRLHSKTKGGKLGTRCPRVAD